MVDMLSSSESNKFSRGKLKKNGKPALSENGKWVNSASIYLGKYLVRGSTPTNALSIIFDNQNPTRQGYKTENESLDKIDGKVKRRRRNPVLGKRLSESVCRHLMCQTICLPTSPGNFRPQGIPEMSNILNQGPITSQGGSNCCFLTPIWFNSDPTQIQNQSHPTSLTNSVQLSLYWRSVNHFTLPVLKMKLFLTFQMIQAIVPTLPEKMITVSNGKLSRMYDVHFRIEAGVSFPILIWMLFPNQIAQAQSHSKRRCSIDSPERQQIGHLRLATFSLQQTLLRRQTIASSFPDGWINLIWEFKDQKATRELLCISTLKLQGCLGWM